MLLRRYQSLGRLPEVVVLAFLLGAVAALGYTAAIVIGRCPVLLVPEAQGVVRLAPARADVAYVRAFTGDFLQDWSSWTPYTYAYRRARAIAHLMPSIQAAVQHRADENRSLLASLQASESFSLTALEIRQDATRPEDFEARFSGRITTYFGGVGGEPDPLTGCLWLHAITPSARNPLCVEVAGFRLDPAPLINALPAAASGSPVP